MKSVMKIVWAVLLFALVGCAGKPVKHGYEIVNPAPVITPDDKTGVVCFLRESRFIMGGIYYDVMEGNERIGLLRSGSYFMIKSEPGLHTFWTNTETKSSISVNVEANKYKYVVGALRFNGLSGRPQFEEVTETTGQRAISRLKYTVPATKE